MKFLAALVATKGLIVVTPVVLVLLLSVQMQSFARPNTADIPNVALAAYVAGTEGYGCDGLDWSIVAAIGKIESDHGRFGGATADGNGTTSPPIIGVALDGSPGVMAIADTDAGLLDGDAVWDRAVGPMQFIPTTWNSFAIDADGNGRKEPQNFFDAAATTARYLCASAPASGPLDVEAAIRRYNNSAAYVADVLEVARTYVIGASTGIDVLGAIPVCPVPGSTFIDDWHFPRGNGTRLHLGLDMFAPVGEPIYAPISGFVELGYGGAIGGNVFRLTGDSGAYVYGAHLHEFVGESRYVLAGEVIGTVGRTGNAASTPPHLHIQFHPEGRGTAAVPPFPAMSWACEGTSLETQNQQPAAPATTVGQSTQPVQGGLFQ